MEELIMNKNDMKSELFQRYNVSKEEYQNMMRKKWLKACIAVVVGMLVLVTVLLFASCEKKDLCYLPHPHGKKICHTSLTLDFDTRWGEDIVTSTYAGGGGVQPVDTAVSYLPAGSFLPEASFSGELCLMAGNAYSIVAWADYVKAGPPAADLYYDTADLTGITQLVPDGNSEGVDAEDAYTAAVSYTASASAGMWSGEPDKLVMALTRPLTRVQFRNLALNGVPDLTQGTCRIACTSTAAGANAVLESGIAGGEQPMRFNALTGKVSGTETLSPSQQAQVQANGSVSPSFDPYVYIFFDTPADPGRDLTITVRYTAAGGGETSYGVKKAAAGVGMSAGNVAGVLAATEEEEEEEEGTPLEIFRVGLNRSILIKANSVDDGSLTLYAIPAALPTGF